MQDQKPDLLARLRDVPHQPGVYVMRDRLHRVIYVGKAKDLRKRLSNYFQPSQHKRHDIKTRALVESIWDFEVHTVRNEPESLILEGKLIKEFRPRYNISFRDDKRFLLVRVHMGEDYPRFSLTRLRKPDGGSYYGPYVHSYALKTTINWLNKHFGLRVCRPLVPGELDYKHCSNDIIKNCCAPCIGRVSSVEYKARVAQAVEFLEGKSKDLVTALEEEMHKAAQRLDFERAAELRDMVESFNTTLVTTRSFERGARIRAVSTIDPKADVRELAEELKLERLPLVIECFDIANIGLAHCVASMVCFRNGVPDPSSYRRYRIKVVSGQNDFASMAEVVRRRYSRVLLEAKAALGDDAEFSQEDVVDAMRRMTNDECRMTNNEEDESDAEEAQASTLNPQRSPSPLPDLIIVDGGKGQLGMAVTELQRLGLHGLAVVGLAKEKEEIFKPGESESYQISHERGALKLLQRIRDEAHRWANGYHQLLLKRRVRESVLDDCPGVSKTRKASLLRTFGSVAQLRKASVEDIAKVPGIGKNIAAGILQFLQSHQPGSGESAAAGETPF